MNSTVFFLNMFSDYEPPEPLYGMLSQAAITAADIDPELRLVTVAVMGCVVNGPGEAREADIGIAGGDGCGMLFEKGQQICKLPYDELLPALLKRIEAM